MSDQANYHNNQSKIANSVVPLSKIKQFKYQI